MGGFILYAMCNLYRIQLDSVNSPAAQIQRLGAKLDGGPFPTPCIQKRVMGTKAASDASRHATLLHKFRYNISDLSRTWGHLRFENDRHDSKHIMLR